MDSLKAGYWLQILGNFGLVFGLILVAVQIKQNTDIAKAQMLNDQWIAGQHTYLARMGENPAASLARAINTPNDLTDEDLIVLDAILAETFLRVSWLEALQDRGFELYDLSGPAIGFADEIGTEFGAKWWEIARDPDSYGSVPATWLAPRLTRLIDDALERRGPEHYATHQSWLERLRPHPTPANP